MTRSSHSERPIQRQASGAARNLNHWIMLDLVLKAMEARDGLFGFHLDQRIGLCPDDAASGVPLILVLPYR